MRRIGFVFLVLCFTLFGNAQSKTATYRNPVIAGDFADPSVIRVGNTYYAVGTSSEWGPVYPIYTSTDLVNWTYLGPVFTQLPEWTMGSFWAPELFYRNGTFYLYYTARRKSDKHSYIGVATTSDIRKPFIDRGLLLEWTSEAIDAFVVEDSGKLYLTWKAYGLDNGKAIELLGAELQWDGLKVTGEAFTLLQADASTWERGGIEGQALLKHGGMWYMLYSGNACCGANCNYQVGAARAKSLKGLWQRAPQNPLLVGDSAWKCPGHGTVVATPGGRFFYLHHAYSGTDFTFVGRQGVLSELLWNNKTGWPQFRYGTATPVQAAAPTATKQQATRNRSPDFLKDTGTANWVWDVSKPKPGYTINDGVLKMSADSAGSFLGLVLKGGSFTLAADIKPQAELLQSICLYGDAANALGFGVRGGQLELWQLKEGVRTILKTTALPDTVQVVQLQLKSTHGRFYHFSWSDASGTLHSVTETPLDGAYLPRWDRAPRAGIHASGNTNTTSLIKTVTIHYE